MLACGVKPRGLNDRAGGAGVEREGWRAGTAEVWLQNLQRLRWVRQVLGAQTCQARVG